MFSVENPSKISPNIITELNAKYKKYCFTTLFIYFITHIADISKQIIKIIIRFYNLFFLHSLGKQIHSLRILWILKLRDIIFLVAAYSVKQLGHA